MNQFKTPILFLIFNRPDLVKETFPQIRKMRPLKLYLAADGPRKSNQNDQLLCQKSREYVLNSIDWNCEVKTLFRNNNLGCAAAVTKAIDWIFEEEKEAIILEDDCYVENDFFLFMEALLKRFQNDQSIFHIGGVNFINRNKLLSDYYCSTIPHVWGWATWRNRWEAFRKTSTPDNSVIKRLNINEREKEFWKDTLGKLTSGKIDSWAYPWHIFLLETGGRSIVPKKNLVVNLGFGELATHTRGKFHLELSTLDWPIKHPLEEPLISKRFDREIFDTFYAPKTSLKNKIRNLAYRVIPGRIYLRLKNIFYASLGKS